MSLDEQRARVCTAGLLFLSVSLLLTVFGVKVPDAAWGAFGTMVVGPLVTGAIPRYREEVARREEE